MPIRPLKPNRKHEAALWEGSYKLVAGVDEVGRGAWAGPLVVAAVVLPEICKIQGVRDSKLLTKTQRQILAQTIKKSALKVGIGWATVAEIDGLGLTLALQQAGWRALEALGPIDKVLLDGNHNYLAPKYEATTIIKADNCCLNVGAASIVAKVARDNYMARAHQVYPSFNFDKNVGYGTRQHQKALSVDGLTPLHRRLFAPIKLVADGLD